MENNIQKQIEKVLRLRRKLAELENRRKGTDASDAGLWQDFMEVTLNLEKVEEDLHRNCKQLSGDIKTLRTDLMQQLEKYNRLREQMKQVEEQFLLNIVRPGQRLQEAIQHRKSLEKEYLRIQRGIRQGGYADLQELQMDIRQVLVFSETVSERDGNSHETDDEDAVTFLKQLDELTVDDFEEFLSIEELAREFKQVVLPAIHPDTSNTPNEIFKTVFEAYQKKDPLLMEAYIVQYSEEISVDPRIDLLDETNMLFAARERCQRLSGHMRNRVERLESELVEQEIDNLEKLRIKMQNQRQEIVDRIRTEAEQILFWREKIDNLVNEYKDWYAQTGMDE